jgi:uncharacterized protein YggE
MKSALASLAALLLCTSFASANITVSGTGKITYFPDVGYITVGVSTEDKTAAEAWNKNGEIVKKLFEALKALGVEDKDMKTSNINVSPKYVHPKDQEAILVGYTATYDLSVTVRDLKAMGKILDAMVANGANRHMNIAFGAKDTEKLLDEARKKAVAEARKKADIYATGAGASLGQVVEISEGNYNARPIFREYQHLAVEAGKDLPIAAGEQEMSVTVTLTYALNHPAGSPKL